MPPRSGPSSRALRLCLGLLALGPASGQRCPEGLSELGDPNCGAEDPECPFAPPFRAANVTEDGPFRHVRTSYCPPYDWSCLRSSQGRRPCARATTFRIPTRPRPAAGRKVHVGLATHDRLGFAERLERVRGAEAIADLPGPALEDAAPMLGAVGVLLNGVALNAVATKLSEALPKGASLDADRWVDAALAEAWMEDQCHGHLSSGGNYHVHGARWEAGERSACGLPVDVEGQHSQLLGWAFDGYPMYGGNDVGGGPVDPDSLDGCGGHRRESQGGYHYHLVERNSFNIACYHGCPEASNNFRFKGLSCEPEGPEAEPPRPPPRGEL